MSEQEQIQGTAGDRVGELEGLLEQRSSELSQSKDRIAELEQLLSGRDSEIGSVKQALAESESKLAAQKQSLAEAVSSYRTLVVQTNPGVVAGLVNGEDITSINESLKKAQDLVSRVRQGLEAEIAQTRVPAGAPQRTPPDLSGLSPIEKIQYALGGKK